MASIPHLPLTPATDVHLSILSIHANALLRPCLWPKHLSINAEKIRQSIEASHPAVRCLTSVLALDDWNIPPGHFTISIEAFRGHKVEPSSDSSPITIFKWLHENRDKSLEVVSFIKSLHDNEHVWFEPTSRAKSVHRPIIDWAWQVLSEAPGLEIDSNGHFQPSLHLAALDNK